MTGVSIGGVVMTGSVIGSESRRRSACFALFTVPALEVGSTSRS
jgi:hypothetical protein